MRPNQHQNPPQPTRRPATMTLRRCQLAFLLVWRHYRTPAAATAGPDGGAESCSQAWAERSQAAAAYHRAVHSGGRGRTEVDQ